MFGLNDNNSQQPIPSNDPGVTDAPAAPSDNPFNDSSPTVAAPLPTTQESPAPAFSGSALREPAASPPSTASAPTGDNLIDLKQQALHSLQPLVSHLDQSPEEKFKTTMMLIQATDNSALVKQAYEAANEITDEKARAQALLDVVNEINYFTHQANGGSEAKA